MNLNQIADFLAQRLVSFLAACRHVCLHSFPQCNCTPSFVKSVVVNRQIAHRFPAFSKLRADASLLEAVPYIVVGPAC
jgi:hypothetical protein